METDTFGVIDRPGSAASSCECYAAVQEQLHHCFPYGLRMEAWSGSAHPTPHVGHYSLLTGGSQPVLAEKHTFKTWN